MNEAPKRPRGRPRKLDAPTGAQRTAAWRAAHNVVTVELSREVAGILDRVADSQGDPSRRAIIERLARDAEQRL